MRGNRQGSPARNNPSPAGDRHHEKQTFRGVCFQPGEKAGNKPDFFDRLNRPARWPGGFVGIGIIAFNRKGPYKYHPTAVLRYLPFVFDLLLL